MKPRLFKTQHALDAFLESRRGKGDALHVLILHDEGCSPSRCSCEPWFEVRELTADNVLEGQRLQDAWVKRSSS